MVYVDGALWKARCENKEALEVGSTVEVVAVDSLTLIVRKINA
jgi:membrane protein implicated in regulation of membrane protease activity